VKQPPRSGDTVLQPDLCIIGAGPAGLSIAAAGALMGISIVLVADDTFSAGDRDLAAAALRAAANHAHAFRNGFRFGIGPRGEEPEVDFSAMRTHMRAAVERQAPMRSLDRYRAMGIRVIEGGAQFKDSDTVLAGKKTVKARRFVIATGSRPLVPEISGLDTVAYLTEETILDLSEPPRHLMVLGGDTAGLSLAQTYRRLGAHVTVMAPEERLLAGEDPEIVAVLQRGLVQEGIDFRLGTEISGFEQRDGNIVAQFSAGTEPSVVGSHLVIAVGRVPSFEGLHLEAGRIQAKPGGIVVDRRMRSSNSRVHAVGDSTGHFNHAAARQAGVAFRNAVLHLPTGFNPSPVPRIIHCDPELASIGLTEEQARAKFSTIRVLRAPFSDNDRALADHATPGHIKAVATPSGKILGCSIVGRRAHDLIVPWALAMEQNLSVSALADIACPHPGYSEATKAIAVEFLKLSAQAPLLRRALNFVRLWS
jgi:pyruvate/2-oxoglutarate dehydrogenase complex dihydrolipoamide dehydrogenase (E3) component